ncbi:hypothetical protein ACFWF7_29900 [Nocardia sp. NPDC060256]|uniref:hypothetical protein n=1 Tax=unclassified Nocardia TaxID=2637762 RepID=UPI00364A88C5
MRIKSKLAKTALATGLAIGVLGIGAGVASADPGHDQQPGHGQDQHPGPGSQPGPQPGPSPQPAGHGFWLFGQWIPLP